MKPRDDVMDRRLVLGCAVAWFGGFALVYLATWLAFDPGYAFRHGGNIDPPARWLADASGWALLASVPYLAWRLRSQPFRAHLAISIGAAAGWLLAATAVTLSGDIDEGLREMVALLAVPIVIAFLSTTTFLLGLGFRVVLDKT